MATSDCHHAVHGLEANLRMLHETVDIDIFVGIVQLSVGFILKKWAKCNCFPWNFARISMPPVA